MPAIGVLPPTPSSSPNPTTRALHFGNLRHRDRDDDTSFVGGAAAVANIFVLPFFLFSLFFFHFFYVDDVIFFSALELYSRPVPLGTISFVLFLYRTHTLFPQ